MYAAAGGASLASRQARRKQKQHHTNENMHQQFHKRFQQLQHQHAPACAEGYHYMRTSSSGLLSPSHLPSCTDLHDRGHTIDFNMQEHLLEGKSSDAWLEKVKKGERFSSFAEISPPLMGQTRFKISEGQRKWAKGIKHHDPSYGGSIEDLRGGLHRQYDTAANMLLYIGLCSVALGLVIAFVGTGEKGFKTVQLRLIGPSIIGFGTFCCFLRIIFCFCPTKCMRKRLKHSQKNKDSMSNGTRLKRQGLTFEEKAHIQYYKHLPFQGHMAGNFVLYDQNYLFDTKRDKKRVSLATNKNRKPGESVFNRDTDYFGNDANSDTLSALRDLSPLHEEDLIDFQPSSNTFVDLPSLGSSMEYLDDQLKNDGMNTETNRNFTTEEQMQHLKSTLTFRDSVDKVDDYVLSLSYEDFDLQDNNNTNDTYAGRNETNIPEHVQELVLSAGELHKKDLNVNN